MTGRQQSMTNFASSKRVDDPSELQFDDYWDKVEFNAQITEFTLWTEGVRQWFIILCTIGFSILFIRSLINLRRTSQGWDIDQIILIAELVKVS